MSSRKIPRNHLHLTGLIASPKNPTQAAFEGTLERDFYILLDFRDDVLRFEAQPLTLKYVDAKGVVRPYTPDTLVTFRPDPVTGKKPAKWLVEVKDRESIRKNWPAIKRKYRAARRLAKERGWRFSFMTEKEIRTPFLDNAKFLRSYRLRTPDLALREAILAALGTHREACVDELLAGLGLDPLKRAEAIATLWALVALGEIDCDLDAPLTMRTRLRISNRQEGQPWKQALP